MQARLPLESAVAVAVAACLAWRWAAGCLPHWAGGDWAGLIAKESGTGTGAALPNGSIALTLSMAVGAVFKWFSDISTSQVSSELKFTLRACLAVQFV